MWHFDAFLLTFFLNDTIEEEPKHGTKTRNKISYNSYVKSSFFDFKIDLTSLEHRLKLAMAKCSAIGQVFHVFMPVRIMSNTLINV